MSEIIFNIIYTPDTVQRLAFMARSLLHWSDCSFRLVSNGCPPSEQSRLRSMCAGHPRLEYYPLPTTQRWPHGQALDFLRILSRGEHFGFLDSDIFACGEFMPDVMNARAENDVVFSGVAPWMPAVHQVIHSELMRIRGPYHVTDTGIEIGCSYFALYDARRLEDLLTHTPLSFLRCDWNSISNEHRNTIRRFHNTVEVFDTTRLINLVLLSQGARLKYITLPNLIHIGATSRLQENRNQPKRSFWSYIPGGARIKRALQRRPPQSNASQREDQVRIAMQHHVYGYFSKILNALSEQSPLPSLPDIADAEVRTCVQATTTALIETYRQFAD